MASDNKQILTDLSPLLKHYTDGTVERLIPFPYAPPSLTGPVLSKDITISPFVSARIYLSEPLPSAEKLPILLYFHGGGFCINSAFSSRDHHYITQLSSQSRALIISVEYRLAPEHLLPAAYDDSWTALNWLCSHSLDLHDHEKEPWVVDHGDMTKIFVGGDSAGGNIAFNLGMRAGSDPLPGNLKIFGALLSHPGFWGSRRPGEEHPREDLGEHLLDRIWLLVHPNARGGFDDPVMNPISGEGAPCLAGFGCEKVMVCLSEKDEVTIWSLAFVEKLENSGWKGQVEVVEVQGEDHCFQWFTPDTDKAKDLIKKMADFISK